MSKKKKGAAKYPTPVLLKFGEISRRGDKEYLEIFYYKRSVSKSSKKDSLRKRLKAENVPSGVIKQRIEELDSTYKDPSADESFDIDKTYCGHFYIHIEGPESTEGLHRYQAGLENMRKTFSGSNAAGCVPWFYFLNTLMFRDDDINNTINRYSAAIKRFGSIKNLIDAYIGNDDTYSERGCVVASIKTQQQNNAKSHEIRSFTIIDGLRPSDKWESYMDTNIAKKLEGIRKFVTIERKKSFAEKLEEGAPIKIKKESNCLATQQLLEEPYNEDEEFYNEDEEVIGEIERLTGESYRD